MAASDSPGDLGIVYYKLKTPGNATYVDARGLSVAAEALTTSYTAMVGGGNPDALVTAVHKAGGTTEYCAFVKIALNGATSIEIALEGQYGNDPTLDASWGSIQTTNQASGTTATTHSLSADGLYLVQTMSHAVCENLRWQCKYTGGGAGDGTSVRIAVRVQ